MIRLRGGLAVRLFAAQVLVVLAGGATSALVAAAIGPPIFRDHLRQATVVVGAEARQHVEDAYTSASAVSFGVALLAALGAALTVSAYLARRVGHSVECLARASAQVAESETKQGVTVVHRANERIVSFSAGDPVASPAAQRADFGGAVHSSAFAH